MSQIIVAYSTEGNTDFRFLESVIQRTFEDVAFECERQIEVLPIIQIPKSGGDFVTGSINCLKKALDSGAMVCCIHVDADDATAQNVQNAKIEPLNARIGTLSNTIICKNMVPVIPIQMSEAWILADKALFKEEINTTLSDTELKIERHPEAIADPKAVLENAIRIANRELPKRRRRELKLTDLYSVIGQKLAISQLEKLKSYESFRQSVRRSYVYLNYLRDL